jgi:deazaflavin-dependent oxidoreductase (nitroreductase family)
MAETRRGRHRVLGRLQQSVINPVVGLAWDLGIPIPGDALLETIGRRTGRPRRTPVCNGLDGETFWLVAQRGRSAGWVRNIEADPRVRVRVSGLRTGWRAGTARILDGDDPHERQRIIARANPARWLCVGTARALNTSPVTVRIDLDVTSGAGPGRAVRIRDRSPRTT